MLSPGQVEQGSKNHEVVPTPLIQQIASLRSASGVHKCISTLAKAGLIAKVKNARCTSSNQHTHTHPSPLQNEEPHR